VGLDCQQCVGTALCLRLCLLEVQGQEQRFRWWPMVKVTNLSHHLGAKRKTCQSKVLARLLDLGP